MTTRRDPNFVYENSWGSAVPTSSGPNPNGFTCANVFRFTASGFIVGARFFRDLSDIGNHLAFVRVYGTTPWLADARFRTNPSGGSGPDSWQHAYFHPRIPIVIGTQYELCLWFQNGPNYVTLAALNAADIVSNHVVLPRNLSPFVNGESSPGADLNPSNADNGARYGIDVLFYRR